MTTGQGWHSPMCGRPVPNGNRGIRCTRTEPHEVPARCHWYALDEGGHVEYRRAYGDCVVALGDCDHCKDRKRATQTEGGT